jgi:nucleotide-binding universal stress UspA family protein
MKVLIATDGSENANQAASLFARLPHTGPLEVHVLTVIYMPPDDSGGLAYSWLPEFIEAEEERARAGFAQIAAMFRSDEVVTNHLICHGHVGHMITEEAKRLGVGLIVIGAQGHSAIARVLLGSTSDFVATQSTCSVLAVRPDRVADSQRPLRIAIAYDGSAPAEAALDEFMQTSWGRKCTVHVVHVLPHASIFSQAGAEEIDAQRKAGLALVQTAAVKLRAVVDDVTTHVFDGTSIGEVITDFAERNQIDIVQLGDTGRSALKQLFLGSVTQYVLRHAVCSVWITRTRRDHSPS